MLLHLSARRSLLRCNKFCLSRHHIRLTSFAADPARWNNTTVMLFWPQSELWGNVTWMWPSLEGSACKLTLSPDHLKTLQVIGTQQLAASYFTFWLQLSIRKVTLYSWFCKCLLMFEKTNNSETHGMIWSGFESQSFALCTGCSWSKKKKKNVCVQACAWKVVRWEKEKKKSFQHCLFFLMICRTV